VKEKLGTRELRKNEGRLGREAKEHL